MQENLVVKKATPLGARVWTSLLVFGFIGQIAWMVENVYFSTYIQKNITSTGWATSATVAASAIAAGPAAITPSPTSSLRTNPRVINLPPNLPIRYNKLRKFQNRRIENSPQNKGQGQRHLVE